MVIEDWFGTLGSGNEALKFLFDIKNLSSISYEDLKICCDVMKEKLIERDKKRKKIAQEKNYILKYSLLSFYWKFETQKVFKISV